MALLEALGGFGQGFSNTFPDTFQNVLQNILKRRQLYEQAGLENQLQSGLINLRSANKLNQLQKAAELTRETLRQQPKTIEQVIAPLIETKAGGGTLAPAQQQTVDEFFASKQSPLDKIYSQLNLGNPNTPGTGTAGAGVAGGTSQGPPGPPRVVTGRTTGMTVEQFVKALKARNAPDQKIKQALKEEFGITVK